MNSPIQPDYKFERGERGIFVEIYLPKKAEFQGRLYETLKRGFAIEKVKAHFKVPEKLPDIKRLIEDYHACARLLDSPEAIEAFPAVFKGYSMYEVEGVFLNSSTGRTQSELTQIVRIMFRPDFKQLLDDYQQEKDVKRTISQVIKEYQNYPGDLTAFRAYREAGGNLSGLENEVLDYWTNWTDYVGLFVFGYLVYEICDQIACLCSRNEMDWDEAEDEIWVTSFWNLQINPISKLTLPNKS